MPTNILNLPDYHIIRVDENDHDYHISAEVSNPESYCFTCGHNRLIGHGRNEQLVRDLPMHGKRVGIYVNTRRWRCLTCGKTFMEPLPGVNAKREMTERLVKWIGQQSLKRTFASIADDTGLDEKTVRNVFRDFVKELEAQHRFETPQWMGIDEIHLSKPRCVITNIESNTLVNMLPTRDKKAVMRYLSSLPGKDTVQYVAMDMWAPYRDAVETVLPQARIVIDKFHVVRMANDAMEKARKSLRASLTPKQRRGLMHDRFILLKRQHDLNQEEQLCLDGWIKNYPPLSVAHRLKETFFGLYRASSREDALVRYTTWRTSVTSDMLPYFSHLIRAVDNWQPYILNYFEHPITNAFTESLNNLIRWQNRAGRGYSFEALRAKILFTEGAYKFEQPRPKFERKRTESATDYPRVAEEVCEYGLPPLDRRTPLIKFAGLTTRKSSNKLETAARKNYGVDVDKLLHLFDENTDIQGS